MLRVLVIPRMHTTTKVTGCSGFNTIRWAFEEMVRQGLAQVEMILPKGLDYSMVPQSDSLVYTEDSRTFKPSIRCDTVETGDALIERFHSRKLDADVVFTDYNFSSAHHSVIQYETTFGGNIPDNVPIVTWFSEHIDQESLQYFQRPAAMPLFMLSALAGELTFISECARDGVVAHAPQWFKPSVVSKIRSGAVMLPCIDTTSTDFDEIYQRNLARKRAAAKSGGGAVLMNAAAVSPRRRFNVLSDAAERARILVPGFRFKFYTQTEHLPAYLEKDWIEVEKGVSRDVLMSRMDQTDIVFDGNTFEGTALFLWESIMSGAMPLIFEDRHSMGWLKGRIPPDYRYVANNVHEVATLLTIMAREANTEAFIEEQAKVRDFVRKRVAQDAVARSWFAELGRVVVGEIDFDKYRRSMHGKIVLAAREKMDGPLSGKALGAFLAAHSDTGKADPSAFLSRVAFRKLMQSCGFRDVGVGRVPVWDRGWEDWIPESRRSL